MKQTAVNWFANELLKNENIEKAIIENFSIASEYYNKAKEMEREQMLEVSKAGCFGTFEFEDYYNETYNSERIEQIKSE